MAKDLLYLLFFNIVYLCTLFTKTPIGESRIHPWLYVQYFFSYELEFTKRGLIGSLFHLFGMEPNQNTIILFSIIVANIFFILFYRMAKKAFLMHKNTLFLSFIILFLLSNATSMQFAYDIGRFDYVNLMLLMLTILLLAQPAKFIYGILISVLIFLMILNHEAIIFIGLPVILAISYNEVKNSNYSTWILYLEFVSIFVALLVLFLFGKADNTTLATVNEMVHMTFPTLYTADALGVWQNSLLDSIALTLSEYPHVWKSFFIVLPLVGLYTYLFSSLLQWKELDFSQKMVFLSPLGILPMFILGHDFFRWFALFVIVSFISFIYLLGEKKTPIQCSKKDIFVMVVILLYSLMGPLGVMEAFPKSCLNL